MENIENKKHRLELEWVFITSVSDRDLYQHLQRSQYPMRKGSSAERKCTVHENADDHKMKVTYIHCSSSLCIQGPSDKCPLRGVIKRCSQSEINNVYHSPDQHANLYLHENQEDLESTNGYGFDPAVRRFLVDMLNDHPRILPSTMGKNLLIESRKETSNIYGLALPNLQQIQRLKSNLKNNDDGLVDREKMAQIISERGFKIGMSEDKAFIFGSRNGTGEDNDPLMICVTSVSWLSWLRKYREFQQVHHCDGTYKIIKNRFPVIVYGRSDVSGQFHPIAVAVTSRETHDDYEFFFKSLQDVCKQDGINIEFDRPQYLVIDASDAEYNGAQSVFGEPCQIAMCWFHVVENIKKRSDVPTQLLETVLNNVRTLHFCYRHEFVDKRNEIVDNWRQLGLNDFADYFVSQWLSGKFTAWQTFHTPAGYASTSNPVESFNHTLKKLFTKREKLTVDSFVTMALDDLIPFYAIINKRKFLFYNMPSSECRTKANELNPEKFVGSSSDQVVFYHSINRIHEINFDDNSCSCRWYIAYAICSHVVKACHLFDRELYNAITTRPYTTRSKRGAKPKRQPTAQYLQVPTVPEAPIEPMLLRVEKRKLPDNEDEGDRQSQPKKRGRKPLPEEEKARRKAVKATTSNPVGRPKKAPPALETD